MAATDRNQTLRCVCHRDRLQVQKLVGYQIDNRRDDGNIVVTLEVGPQHLNYHGMAHGGIIVILPDSTCGQIASQYFSDQTRPPVMTVSLTTSFFRPCKPDPVRCSGVAIGGGRKTVTCDAALIDREGHLVAKAVGVFRRIAVSVEGDEGVAGSTG